MSTARRRHVTRAQREFMIVAIIIAGLAIAIWLYQ
jgi:Tfp pilus assembly major pilin PilA